MSPVGATWRSIWRFHRLFAGVLVLEYALTFAIVLIASGVLVTRARAISQDSGIREQGLYVLVGRGIRAPLHRFQLSAAQSRFAARVSQGNVAMGSSAPFLGMYSQSKPVSIPDDSRLSAPLQVNAYEGDARFAAVLGLHLRAGRWFEPDEWVLHYGDTTHVVILSDSLAQRLFHRGQALGQQVDIAGQIHTVIGIVGPLAAPQYLGSQHTTETLLLPRSTSHVLLIRHDGPETDLQPVLAALRRHDAGKVRWSFSSYAAVRNKYFRSDRLTVAVLAAVVLSVLVTALCGVLGLTNYWIAKRRPQIAIRRALGARKRDIDRQFLVETALLVTPGLLLGVALEVAFGLYARSVPADGGMVAWIFAIAATSIMAMLVVHVSLHRWQRMSPTELMRLG